MYQPVHNLSSLNAQLSQLDLFSFYNSFGESVCFFLFLTVLFLLDKQQTTEALTGREIFRNV